MKSYKQLIEELNTMETDLSEAAGSVYHDFSRQFNTFSPKSKFKVDFPREVNVKSGPTKGTVKHMTINANEEDVHDIIAQIEKWANEKEVSFSSLRGASFDSDEPYIIYGFKGRNTIMLQINDVQIENEAEYGFLNKLIGKH